MKFPDNYKEPCPMCVNARIDDELTDENDFSSMSIGKADSGFRMSINAGYNKPVRICVEQWNDIIKENFQIACYYPNYCPNCGRELFEYKENDNNEIPEEHTEINPNN